MNIKNERLAGSNLDGSAKVKSAPTKEMTAETHRGLDARVLRLDNQRFGITLAGRAAEVAELKKLLDASFKGVK